MEVSEIFPNLANCVDDMAVVRSLQTDTNIHPNGVFQMNLGLPLPGLPSMGAWVSYGLGTENESLPGFVVIKDTKAMVVNGARCWGSGFMPASYQGTLLEPGDEPISYLNAPKNATVHNVHSSCLSKGEKLLLLAIQLPMCCKSFSVIARLFFTTMTPASTRALCLFSIPVKIAPPSPPLKDLTGCPAMVDHLSNPDR